MKDQLVDVLTRYEPLFRKITRQRIHNPADREDVLSTARESVLRAELNGAAIENPIAYAAKAAESACVDFYRSRSKQPKVIHLDQAASSDQDQEEALERLTLDRGGFLVRGEGNFRLTSAGGQTEILGRSETALGLDVHSAEEIIISEFLRLPVKQRAVLMDCLFRPNAAGDVAREHGVGVDSVWKYTQLFRERVLIALAASRSSRTSISKHHLSTRGEEIVTKKDVLAGAIRIAQALDTCVEYESPTNTYHGSYGWPAVRLGLEKKFGTRWLPKVLLAIHRRKFRHCDAITHSCGNPRCANVDHIQLTRAKQS